MGQYFYVVNMDKRQYLHPHCFDDGLKLMEFGLSGCGTMAGLALLLRRSSEGGGGDFDPGDNSSHAVEIVGSWAGDRIVVVGDYDNSRLYQACKDGVGGFINVSHYVLDALMLDEGFAELVKSEARYRMCKETSQAHRYPRQNQVAEPYQFPDLARRAA